MYNYTFLTFVQQLPTCGCNMGDCSKTEKNMKVELEGKNIHHAITQRFLLLMYKRSEIAQVIEVAV